jgi:hypothetical protein
MGCAEVAYCENCGDGHGFTRCPNTGGVGPAARNGVECTEFRREVGWGGLDQVTVGGQSTHHARAMHPDWARSIRDQCQWAQVPFYFKQWVGRRLPGSWNGCRLRLTTPTRPAEAIAATHGVASWGHLYKFDHAPWSIERADREPCDLAGMRRVGWMSSAASSVRNRQTRRDGLEKRLSGNPLRRASRRRRVGGDRSGWY